MKSRFLLSILAALCVAAAIPAAPSGGPYGPIQRRYALPGDAGAVFYVSPVGDDAAEGKSVESPTSLEAAFKRARTGDAIVLRGGEYRVGDLWLNQRVTMQPYADEWPILKGTRVASDWESLRYGLWRTRWETLFPMKPESWWRRERNGATTPLYLFNNDMVFVDGEMLKPVGWEGEIDETSYFIDYESGYVYIGIDPKDRVVEITAFDNAITRTTKDIDGRASDRLGPTIRGIVFTQYAYRAIEMEGYDPEGISPESEHGKDVVGTTIEHCSFTFCSRVGAYLRGDDLVFRHNLVSDTSTEGIFLLASNDALFEKNLFRRNNIEGIQGYFPSALKIFNQTHRVVCRDNLVMDNKNSNGIWYDVGNEDGVFINNWIQDSQVGFFYEISRRAICAGNVFVNCGKGVWALNAAGVQVYHNTFVNSVAAFHRTERSAVGDHFGWHPATGPEVEERVDHVFVNNLLYGDASFEGPLVEFAQPEELRERLTMQHVTSLDGNVYVRAGDPAGRAPLARWSPAATDTGLADYATLEAFREENPEFEKSSAYLREYYGPLFVSRELGHYQLLSDFPASAPRAPIPAEIRKLLGAKDAATAGAFPVAR